nr:thioredoxin domain-containing protein [Actinomycetales bacterium]
MADRRILARVRTLTAVAALAAVLAACGGAGSEPSTPVPGTGGTTAEATAEPSTTGSEQPTQWVVGADQRNPAEGTTGNVTVTGTTVVVGNPDAEKRLQIFMDFFCPHCATLHGVMDPDLVLWAGGDQVAVEYTIVDYLSPRTTHIYSARAANLLAYVGDTDPESYPAVLDALLENKPETTTEVVTDAQLLQIARDAGATLGEDATAALGELRYYMWVETGTREAAEAGVTGIPQVWVDGARVAGETHEETAAIAREEMNR